MPRNRRQRNTIAQLNDLELLTNAKPSARNRRKLSVARKEFAESMALESLYPGRVA